MSVVGTVSSLWRYPVKSMAGEECEELFLSFSGVYGDRLYAFAKASGPAIFPYLTGRDGGALVAHRARFLEPARSARPANLGPDARATGITALSGPAEDFAVEVQTPAGDRYAIEDEALARQLSGLPRDGTALTLMRSDRAMTDCAPVSLLSLQTVRALEGELGIAIGHKRFRANIYADLVGAAGFAEDSFEGCRLRIGPSVEVAITLRDGRCKMITLDPETGAAEPKVLEHVTREHEGKTGVYGAVLAEGIIRRGDEIELLD